MAARLRAWLLLLAAIAIACRGTDAEGN